MNERIQKWAEAMFDREIERVRDDLEISKICSGSTILTNEHTEHFAQKAKDLEFYLGWLNGLREYANV